VPRGCRNCTDEVNFDRFDAVGEVVIAFEEHHDAVYELGQYHPGVDRKRPISPRALHRLTERVDISDEEIRPGFQKADGEEIGPALEPKRR
jgi:hypothetical protein